jgi:hypothetical protein
MGLIEVDALGFEGASLYAELAAGTALRIDVYYALFLIQEHGDFLLRAYIIAGMIRTMPTGMYAMIHQDCISFQENTS